MVWLEVTAAGEKHLFRFDKPRIALGRAPDNDLVLPHETVAGHHLVIDAAEGPRDGDVLLVGAYTVVFLTSLPPEGREAELLRSLEARPTDDDLRAVYSDYLEEVGRMEEAEYVRLQISLARLDLDADGKAWLVQSTRLRGLGKRFSVHWRRIVARPPIEKCNLAFEVQCPKRWSDLAPTSNPAQRFCGACKETVHYASSISRARQLAEAGACVAVDLSEPRYDGDLDPPPRRMMMGAMMPSRMA